ERRDLFGGCGVVRMWDLLRRQRAGTFTAVLACELEPGGSVGKHVQEGCDEIVIILAGEGTAHVNDQVETLAPGHVVSLPCGATLALSNTGEQLLEYVIVKAAPNTQR